MSENWATVPDFIDYEVSDLGRVRRTTNRGPGKAGHVLTPRRDRHGYMKVSICNAARQPRTVTVHRLVARAFHGEPPLPRMQVAHFDGDKTNNRAENLRWATAHENAADSMRLGRLKAGASHPKAKFGEQALAEIARDKEQGVSTIETAKRLGVCTGTVNRLYRMGNWPSLAPKNLQPENYRIGQRHHKAKLTDDDVRAIRHERRAGAGLDATAAKFGVSRAQISSICTRRTWKHLDSPDV